MNGKVVVGSPNAPEAVGPYSAAIKSGNMVFVSGQLGLDPATKQMAGPTVAEQTERALKNLEALLDVCEMSMAGVVKTTVYLKSMDDFQAMNAAYAKFFPLDPPARATVEVARLPLNGLVEIDAIAISLEEAKPEGGFKGF